MNTEIEGMTHTTAKNIRGAYQTYKNRWRTYEDLFDAYERPSLNKYIAYCRCERMMDHLNGEDLVITSRNTFAFSVCFEFPHPETGEACFAFITRDYDRWAFTDELH